jgi:GNAT superfamily N-acetyltransferase
MQTRIATLEDTPILVELMSEFYANSGFVLHEERASAAFEKILSEETRGRVWILEQDNQPAGYVVLTIGYSMEYGGLDAFVDDLFVRSPYRGKGLGRAALEALLA